VLNLLDGWICSFTAKSAKDAKIFSSIFLAVFAYFALGQDLSVNQGKRHIYFAIKYAKQENKGY
jgi:hypothetical protein